MNTNKFKPIDIILILTAILLLGGVGFAWYHYEQLNTELETKITSQKQELELIRKKMRLLEDLRKNFQSTAAEKDRLIAFIPNAEGQDQFILELERLSQKCQLTLKSCNLAPKPKIITLYPQYEIYQWTVVFEGSYQGLITFLDELPNSNRFVTVSNLETSASYKDDPTKIDLKITCILDLVTIPPQAKVKK